MAASRYQDAALVIAGHGSTINADSSAPTFRHAQAIRDKKIFSSVHECFWKEEPNFRQVLAGVEEKQVYVVPNFISEGYFTQQVIPRELGLDGAITQQDGKDIYYCSPVGSHPSMTEVLLHRANQVVNDSSITIENPSQTASLIICGHGTSLNDNSTAIIYEQVKKIGDLGIYGSCHGALMEQKPFIKDWKEIAIHPDVIVVPFFISDGLHSYEDIPVLLGITTDVRKSGVKNPTLFPGRRLWYATAIGTEPLIADVIVAQVTSFDETHRSISTVA